MRTHNKPVAILTTFLFLCLISTPLFSETSFSDPWFSPDKFLHFAGSLLISSGSYILLSDALMTTVPDYNATVASAGLTFSLGIGKEVYDLLDYGYFSWRDVVWNLAGTIAGVGLMLTLHGGLSTSF